MKDLFHSMQVDFQREAFINKHLDTLPYPFRTACRKLITSVNCKILNEPPAICNATGLLFSFQRQERTKPLERIESLAISILLLTIH